MTDQCEKCFCEEYFRNALPSPNILNIIMLNPLDYKFLIQLQEFCRDCGEEIDKTGWILDDSDIKDTK